VSRTNPVSLGSLNLETLSDSKILYYFGVLAIQTVLLPQFHLTRGRKRDRWGVKMTMYGMTFVRSHVYASRKDAKVDVCKEALKKLKVEQPDWIVPERPGGSLPPVDRDWVRILRGKRVISSHIHSTTDHDWKNIAGSRVCVIQDIQRMSIIKDTATRWRSVAVCTLAS
jgi:hypothetical protein